MPKYHATDTHEAIISLSDFEAVQNEIARRKEKYSTNTPCTQSALSGKTTCSICGKHYRRKKTKTGIVWICSTYNTYGKAYCPSKAVPEIVLTSLVESVGKNEDISKITACDNNTLLFEMTNGDTIKKDWKDRSRAESWTDEMRAEFGRKTRERNKKQWPKLKM